MHAFDGILHQATQSQAVSRASAGFRAYRAIGHKRFRCSILPGGDRDQFPSWAKGRTHQTEQTLVDILAKEGLSRRSLA
jgi:hypothetical protein